MQSQFFFKASVRLLRTVNGISFQITGACQVIANSLRASNSGYELKWEKRGP